MAEHTTVFWVLTPPMGDGRLQALQTRLFREALLDHPPAWAFLPWHSRPGKKEVQEFLPLVSGAWRLEDGWLGLEAGSGLPSPPEGFPGGLWILGKGNSLPPFDPPRLIFRSLRAQQWRWKDSPSRDSPFLEVSVLEELRIGAGASENRQPQS